MSLSLLSYELVVGGCGVTREMRMRMVKMKGCVDSLGLFLVVDLLLVPDQN